MNPHKRKEASLRLGVVVAEILPLEAGCLATPSHFVEALAAPLTLAG